MNQKDCPNFDRNSFYQSSDECFVGNSEEACRYCCWAWLDALDFFDPTFL